MDKNEISKKLGKQILIIQKIDLIFMLSLLFINFLKFFGIIKFNLIIFDIAMLAGYWFGMLTYYAIIEQKEYNKSKKIFVKLINNTPIHVQYEEQEIKGIIFKLNTKYFVSHISLVFSFILLGLSFCIMNVNGEHKEFLKNSETTEARIIKIEKDIEKNFKYDDNDKQKYYNVRFIYSYSYEVDKKMYNNSLELNYSYDDYSDAISSLPKYNEDDIISIRYNKSNPQETEVFFEKIPDFIIYIFLLIIFFIEKKRLYKKDIFDLN